MGEKIKWGGTPIANKYWDLIELKNKEIARLKENYAALECDMSIHRERLSKLEHDNTGLKVAITDIMDLNRDLLIALKPTLVGENGVDDVYKHLFAEHANMVERFVEYEEFD